MKVVLDTENHGTILRYPFDLVAPLASNLDGSLDGFCASVHRQHHVIAEQFGDKLGEAWEYIVVKGSAT